MEGTIGTYVYGELLGFVPGRLSLALEERATSTRLHLIFVDALVDLTTDDGCSLCIELIIIAYTRNRLSFFPRGVATRSYMCNIMC